jgi:hypothetical protein
MMFFLFVVHRKHAGLVRRLAIAHARLHLREEVSLLDMGHNDQRAHVSSD